MTERRKRLDRLSQALQKLNSIKTDLLLTPQEAQWIETIQARNKQFIAHELIACREAEIAEKQKLKAIEKARSEAFKAERAETRRKSGFTGFVRRADGSFGTGRS